jgi:hypothetical protein
MRRMLFLLAILTAALSLWTGISIFHARGSNAYACLVFNTPSRSYGFNPPPYYGFTLSRFKQIDFGNGVTLDMLRPRYPPAPLTTSDGKYKIRITAIDPLKRSLQAEPTNGDAPIVLSGNLHPHSEIFLAPQSDWISYVEGDFTEQNILHMVRFKANGQLERRQRVQFDFPGLFKWSSDGLSAVIYYRDVATSPMNISIWTRLELWRSDSDTFTPMAMPTIDFYSGTENTLWGADGHIVHMINGNNANWLIFMQPDGHGGYTQRVRHVINSHIYESSLIWSPDGRDVLVRYRSSDPDFHHLEMWANDGSTRIHLGEMAAMIHSDFAGFIWAENSQSMLFFNNERGHDFIDKEDDVWNVYRYNRPSNLLGSQVSTLYTGLVGMPVAQSKTPANQNQRLAVRGKAANGTYYLDMLDATSTKAARVLNGADYIGEPIWSPDGRYLAVMSAMGGSGQWQAKITIIQADGQIVRTLNNGLRRARNLFWHGDVLYFVGLRADFAYGQLFSLERLPAEGGPAKILSGGLVTLGLLDTEKIDEFSFWWRSPQGDLGFSAFNAAGELLYQLGVGNLPPTIETDLKDAPLLLNYIPQHSDGVPSLAWRPQHPTEALIALGRDPNGRLYWVNTNGQWRLLQDGLNYWSLPIWSPDGQYFVFWANYTRWEVVLSIFTASGQLVREEKINAMFDQFQRWSNCQ